MFLSATRNKSSLSAHSRYSYRSKHWRCCDEFSPTQRERWGDTAFIVAHYHHRYASRASGEPVTSSGTGTDVRVLSFTHLLLVHPCATAAIRALRAGALLLMLRRV